MRMEKLAGQRERAGEDRMRGNRQRKEMDIVGMLGKMQFERGESIHKRTIIAQTVVPRALLLVTLERCQ